MKQSSETVSDPIASWMELGERVRKRFERITHGSTYEFVDLLCQQFLRDCDKDRLQNFSTKLGDFRKLIHLYQQEILQAEGWGENYQKLESIDRDIRTALGWVDEVWVLGMVDPVEVQRLHQAS